MPTIIIKVDLDCTRCRRKIEKELNRIRGDNGRATLLQILWVRAKKCEFVMDDIEYDKKNNRVIVKGPFDADKLTNKLCCNACNIIKEIEIVEPPPPEPPKKAEPHFQDGLISAREKHKESVEYKKAAEEEWASRQRELAKQAEEVKEEKNLRKRKRAEADMEKRQKQRLEEVRESQRKNEEAIRLKEQHRGEVRLELENMGRRYTDMASILRALGIPVEGGEVRAAYKKALRIFHPDKAGNDIYQQVKAEETFKFILHLNKKLKL